MTGGLRIVLAVALAAGPMVPGIALAKEPMTFTAPPGCTGFLTVQSRGCRVSNYYRCDKDAPGDQWRADFDQDSVFFVSRTDYEAQWVESYDMFPVVKQTLDPNPADPASFSELLAKGKDSFDFGLTEDTGKSTHVTGYDKLTGRTVTVDGVTLQETEFTFAETDSAGKLIRSSKGNEYIDPAQRMFFAGPSEWDLGEGPLQVDGSPKQFILPGEKGFFSTLPIFDCEVTTSQAEGKTTLLPASVKP